MVIEKKKKEKEIKTRKRDYNLSKLLKEVTVNYAAI